MRSPICHRYADFERVVAPGYNPAAAVRQQLDASRVAPQPPPIVDRSTTTCTVVPDARRALPLLKAIADERRWRILILLSAGERIVRNLQKSLRVGQSLLFFHLRTLKDAGLVSDRRDRRSVYCVLDPNGLEKLKTFIRELRPP